jgi:hypothetical protein
MNKSNELKGNYKLYILEIYISGFIKGRYVKH